jgi:hypothetical protein
MTLDSQCACILAPWTLADGGRDIIDAAKSNLQWLSCLPPWMREAVAKGLRIVLMQVGRRGRVVGIDTKEAATELARKNVMQQVLEAISLIQMLP